MVLAAFVNFKVYNLHTCFRGPRLRVLRTGCEARRSPRGSHTCYTTPTLYMTPKAVPIHAT